MTEKIVRFLRDQSGATAMEYSVIGTVIAVLLVVALTLIGTKIKGNFSSTGTGLT